ncbi:MAG: HAMP domain-containing histidine kinase [Bacteroidales bacterium]|nr:HAMP domain-containing histidine kinase [Bacteroidales bacterium]
MKKLIPVIPADFFFTNEEKQQGQYEVLQVNVHRLTYLLYLGLPVTLIHIFVFSFKLAETGSLEATWRTGIIYSHLILFTFFLFAGSVTLAARKKKRTGHRIIKAMPHLIFLLLLVMGGIISGIDQIVTNAITPYLIVCMCSAMLLYIPPLYSLGYFIFSYLVYYFAIGYFQLNTEILLSNYVNGITSIIIGWFLSLTLWRNSILKFRKDLIIRQQQEELALHNSKLVVAAGELKEANRTKDKLFSIISHDLRGPFATLNDLIRYLHSGDINEKEFRELLPDLSKQTEITTELLENLLSWSRSNLKGAVMIPEKIELAEMAENIIQLYHHQAGVKGLMVINDILTEHRVIADRGMISLVFRNLISNAIKFSENSGIIVLSSSSENQKVRITIQDSGTGIPSDKIPLLFGDQYYTTTGTAGEKGTGLGLSLCKDFIERNGGEIFVENMTDKGSRFTFILPGSNNI